MCYDFFVLALASPIESIDGIGPRRAEVLKHAGIKTVGDLLSYKPFRYEDRSRFTRIAHLVEGEQALVLAEVALADLRRTPRQGIFIFELMVCDSSGAAYVKFFNQPYLAKSIKRGQRLIIYGQARRDSYKQYAFCFINPEIEDFEEEEQPIHSGRVVPIYRRIGTLNTRALRRLVHTALSNLDDDLFDPIPESVRRRHRLLPRLEALSLLHYPRLEDEPDYLARARRLDEYNLQRSPAHTRLIFEEFFELQVGFELARRAQAGRKKGRSYVINDRIREAVKRMLPFHPTAAQKRALKEIVDDMLSPRPMSRLLQGDVGCGKTIVALQAMVVAIENGYQTAMMAPTEILAEQHYFNIKRMLGHGDYRIALLTSAVRKGEKERIKAEIAAGRVELVVGTHAIIEEEVEFRNLGLVVIDEQHRFGVAQRSALLRKGYNPDTLVMTATPIPRSLALTLYGDLDLSVIDEMPPGRKPVRTILMTERQREQVYALIRKHVEEGHQVYVVYPLIEESEKLDLKAAADMAGHLAIKVFPQFHIGLLHGRLKSQEKEEVMGRFAAGEIDILVSTTVIEVGVDVSNATLMVIEHAERFGLAQLHQLRGRVGRGRDQSLCILMADARQLASSQDARRRLQIMCRTNDGFKIAEVDLEIRGPGEFAGTRQSGLADLRFGNIVRDRDLLELARREAAEYVNAAFLSRDRNERAILEYIRRSWHKKFGLALIG